MERVPDDSRQPFIPPRWAYAVVLSAVVAAAYAGDVGRGFIKDDAGWILRSRVERASDVAEWFTTTGGFFRPAVAATFALDYSMFGTHPLGYGLTNLILAAACAFGVFHLARALGLPSGAALLAAAIWILNFHGIYMAVLWLSGRTALLLVLFSVLAAIAAARDRIPAACAFALLAMFSKEEAVLLPAILVCVHALRPDPPARARTAVLAAGLVAVLGTYAAFRFRSDAMWPSTAPSFYRFTSVAKVLGKNVAEYADRTLTLSAGAALLALLLSAHLPRLERRDIRIIAIGAVWIVFGFALTLFLPVRSDLYACFPSVGAALACATLVDAAWRTAAPKRRRAMALAALVLPVAFVPIYKLRNDRWTDLGDTSTRLIAEFTDLARTAPAQWEVIVVDDTTSRANAAAALGWAMPNTVELVTGRRPRIWIVPPPSDSAPDERVIAPSSADTILEVQPGPNVIRLPRETWKPAPSAMFY